MSRTTLILLILSLMLTGCFEKRTLELRQGVGVVPEFGFEGSKPLELKGEWEFFFEESIEPAFHGPSAKYMIWPRVWKEGYGYALYRAHLVLPASIVGQEIAMMIPSQSSAMDFWINDVKVGSFGQFAIDAEHSMPARSKELIKFTATPVVKLTARISNFHHARGGTWFALKIGTVQNLIENRFDRLLLETFFIAMCMAIGFYFFLYYLVDHDAIKLFLSLTGIFAGLRQAVVGERLLEYAIPLSFGTGLRLEYMSLYGVFMASFCFVYFYTKPHSNRLIGWIFLAASGFLVIKLFFPPTFFTRFLLHAHVISVAAMLYMAYLSRRIRIERALPARFLWAQVTFMMVMAFIDFALIYFNDGYEYMVSQVGILCFILLQALATAAREVQYVQQIKEEQKDKIHSYQQLQKMIYPHQLNLIQAGRNLEETMPTEQREACVLAFDVVGSSRIKHERAKDFFRRVFHRCNQLMMRDYDPVRMRATAYRIKEIGDGFLCSVGYPFASRTGYITYDSVLLALDYYAIFREEVQRLAYQHPIRCAIGVAFDSIIGFYPESGTQEYDLYGRAIILATRYEEMRKVLYDQGPPSSLLIVQETVYMSLPPVMRAYFDEVNLKSLGKGVRDDPAATVLYVMDLERMHQLLALGPIEFLPKPLPEAG